MPENSTHPDYEAAALDWARARDVLAGEDAVKAGGEKYLPGLDSQPDDESGADVKRASFFNATARTSEAYLGLIFRQPPFVKLPGNGDQGSEVRGQKPGVGRAMEEFANDADMLGTSLTAYAKMVVGNVIGFPARTRSACARGRATFDGRGRERGSPPASPSASPTAVPSSSPANR